MKFNFGLFVALSAVILGTGCKKDIHSSSIGLTGQTKGGTNGFPNFNMQNATARLIAYDNGTGLNCLLGYDISSDAVTLIQNNNSVWTSQGLVCDDGSRITLNNYIPSDNFNEVGGYHIIALDYTGSGHLNYLLAYAPGQGVCYILSPVSPGVWHKVYAATSGGIGGYDLRSVYDKIIAYDLGSGTKNSLIAYRPGSGTVWAIQNQGGNWVGVVKGSAGIGGFDLKGIDDQIVAVDNVPGTMGLICYRPVLGYVWVLTHAPNSTTWNAVRTFRSGLPGFDFTNRQDRMIAYDESQGGLQNYILCYRPGVNGYAKVYYVSASVLNELTLGGAFFNYPMNANPYPNAPNIGDKLVAFNGNNTGISSLVCFQGGTGLTWVLETPSGSPLNFFQAY